MGSPRGSVALDERGRPGIVVDDLAGLFVGFEPGSRRRWSSRRPRVLGTVVDWIRSREPLEEWVDKRAGPR